MQTIKNNVLNELIINKSRFIGFILNVNSEEEIKDILQQMKKNYNDATHICYAYILENKEKAYDDNEPCGTAGIPILTVLKKHNLTNVVGIVIRYFGGIKLGSGGLIRAYTNTINEGLKKATFKDLIKGYIINITFTYKEEKIINSILKNENILNRQYTENITYTIKINKELLATIKNLNYTYQIIEEVYL